MKQFTASRKRPMDFIHKLGRYYFIWVMIAIDAGAALYRHFI
jgi:hypothetical protein